MNLKQKKMFLKESNLLELTPFRLMNHEMDADNYVNVLLPRFNDAFTDMFFQSLLPEKRKYTKIKLDDIGSETWININGNVNVKHLVDFIRQTFGEKVEPAEQRLGKFISMLYEQRYISFKELKD